nr:MBL fold metallo-hydrolase [Allocatelliglobosispora scoriae]
MPDLEITTLEVGDFGNDAYLLRCRHTGEQLLIDAAADAKALTSLIGDGGLASVVTTHGHADHWKALAEIVASTGATAYAHPADAGSLPVPTQPLVDGDTVTVGSSSLEVIHLVGHTPGSIALLYRDPEGPPQIFTGDSLFPGGVGNTRGNAANFTSLLNDVIGKIFDRLPDSTIVHPGHGLPTTLGAERPSLPEWRERGW